MKKKTALMNCTVINGDLNRKTEKNMVILFIELPPLSLRLEVRDS
ncbi:hypothetical protein [Bacillus cereus]